MSKSAKWSSEETELLKQSFLNDTWETLKLKFPNRSRYSLFLKGNKLNLKRNYSHRHADLSSLLQENEETYYWLGFLFADGSLSEKGVLQFSLQKKDVQQVEKFSKFMKCVFYNYDTQPMVSVQNKIQGVLLREKYDWSPNKTYNPPNLTVFDLLFQNKTFFISWLVGFIDGDGCLTINPVNKSKNYNIWCRIRCHESWIDFFKLIQKYIKYHFHLDKKIYVGYENYNKYIKKNNKRYKGKQVRFATYNSELLFLIYYYAIKYKLPYLERKWIKMQNYLEGKYNE